MPKLTDDSVSTIFNNLPKYLSSQSAKKSKTPDERQAELYLRDHQVLQGWHQLDEITSFNDLSNKISDHITRESNWVIIKLDSSVCCCIIDTTNCPVVKVAVKMIPDLSVHLYCKCTEIDRSELSWVLSLSNKLDRWSKLENILSHFQTVDDVTTSKMSQAIGILQELCENVEKVDEKHLFPLKFLAEQLTLRNAPPKMYGSEILLWANQLFITSSKAYAFVCKSVLIL